MRTPSFIASIALALPALAFGQGTRIVVIDPDASFDFRAATTAVAGFRPQFLYAHAHDGQLWLASCADSQCSGGTLEQLRDVAGTDSSLAFTSTGSPVVVFYDFAHNALALYSIPPIAIDDDPTDDVGQFASLIVDQFDRPIVAYYDNTTRSLRLAVCSDPSCLGVSIQTIDDDPSEFIGEYVDLAMGGDGAPVMAYPVLPDGILRVAKCDDGTCSSWSIHDVDSFNVGQYSSIAIGADLNPVMSYYDSANATLKVARCNDPACETPATITTVDDRPGSGFDSSIDVGRDTGLPVVAYRRVVDEATSTDVLAVAECADAACTSASLKTLDEELGHASGFNTDISIGASGAVISYYDATASTFNAAFCDALGCADRGDDMFGDGFDGEGGVVP
jgi:hypothetical protein